MTFNQIKYFVTVAECLSFTEAARCLFITQPALSRQISAMEEELGIRLLLREHRKLRLTPGGVLLYQRFREILNDYSQAVSDAKTANLGYEGSLHIGFLDVYDISDLFPDVLRTFREKYPKISLSMERYGLGELPAKLYDDSLDLILTYGFSLYDQPDLVIVNIQKFTSCMMLHVNHPLAAKTDLCLRDLAQEQFVLLRDSVCEEGHRYISSLFEKCYMHPDIMWADKMEDILLWVQTNNAVSITSDRTIEGQNPSVVLRRIPMEEAGGHDIAMAWRKTNFNQAITVFMGLLEERLRCYLSRDA